MKTTLSILAAATVGLSATAASAAEVTYSDSIALTSTNWTEQLAISQFDSALGTLQSVMITLDGGVQGNGNAESLDTGATDVTLNLSAEIEASIMGASVGTVLPVVSTTQSLSAFDGGIDFGGTSGFASGTLSGTDSDMNTITSAFDAFIGTGDLIVDVVAAGTSTGSGAGNLITQFATSAEATVTVKYTFEEVSAPAVPLPAGAPLVLGALGLLAIAKRHKG